MQSQPPAGFVILERINHLQEQIQILTTRKPPAGFVIHWRINHLQDQNQILKPNISNPREVFFIQLGFRIAQHPRSAPAKGQGRA